MMSCVVAMTMPPFESTIGTEMLGTIVCSRIIGRILFNEIIPDMTASLCPSLVVREMSLSNSGGLVVILP